jgi:hypothetical protein
MQARVGRKDFAGGPEEQTYDLTSSGRGEWTLEGSQRDLSIDLEKKEHLEWLRSWCRVHWLSTFKRSLVYGNKLTYHCCCNSFSRRAFVKMAGHPPLLSIGVLQIPGLRNANSHEDLYQCLLEIIRETTKQGQHLPFPALNRHHVERDDPEEPEDQEKQIMLAKRNSELERELEKTQKQVADLKKDNDRMLQSTKNWHEKYEELLDSGQTMITMMATPRKYRVTDSCCFVDD